MTRVMFVCHGNICRSPMAEFIFKMLVDDRGLSNEFLIKSSATSTEEIIRGVGNPIYPPAARELERHSVPYTRRQATQLSSDDIDKYDLFVGMDSANIRNMHRILGPPHTFAPRPLALRLQSLQPMQRILQPLKRRR